MNSRLAEGQLKDADMSQQTDSDASGAAGGGGGSLEPIWLGVGSPRPQPRVKQNAMFGHVADAFDEKSIFKIGQQPQDRSADRQKTTTQAAGNDHTTTTTTTTTTGSSDGVASDAASTRSSGARADVSGSDGVVTADQGPPRETVLDVVS